MEGTIRSIVVPVLTVVLATSCAKAPGATHGGPFTGGISSSTEGASGTGAAGTTTGDGVTAGGSGTGGGATSSTSGSGGETGHVPLPCDEGFAFDPDPPQSGSHLTVSFTDPEPLVYVDLAVTGPGAATTWWKGITTSDPWTWQWGVTGLSPGVWTFVFSAGDPQMELASCQRMVIDTGEPPPPPATGCEGKYCGDDDGMGGVCTDAPCRVVGSTLAHPSPCGPSEQDSPWQTLDSASCTDGTTCRIWCPYEKCDGCPNGTEAVWVPASETSYEQACKNACEALGACWDANLSLCRNPGMCGQPLGKCPWEP